jgi:hypothetical protein
LSAAQDVRDAFRTEHLQLPGGFLVSGTGERLIKLDLEYHSPEALAELIVRYGDGAPVRLRDIGDVEDGLADDRQIIRFNGKPTVGIGIVKVSNYNTVKLVDDIRARLDAQIIPQLPAGLTLTVSIDDSNPIRKIVSALEDHLVEGTILLGLDEHDEEFLKRFTEFLLTIDLDLAEFTVLTPFPHTQYWQQLEAEGRIIDRDWSRYNAGTVVFRPRRMTPETLQRRYEDAWREFYRTESQTLRMTKLLLPVLREDRARAGRRSGAAAGTTDEGMTHGPTDRGTEGQAD